MATTIAPVGTRSAKKKSQRQEASVPAAPPASSRGRRWWPGAVLALLCGVAFHNALPREFVLDAAPLVRDNARLLPTSSWGALLRSNYWGDFSSDGLWRPLTLAGFRIERNVLGFGNDPAPYVAVNLLLHLGVCLLLWRVALWLCREEWAALGAAALFAVHPIATEIVPNIMGRADLLVALTLLGGLLLWRRYLASGRWVWLVALALVWLAGLLSKENAIVLPVALALVDVLLDWPAWSRRPLATARRRWLAYAGLAVVGIGWLWARGEVLAPTGEGFVAALNNPLVLETPGVRRLGAVALTGDYVVQALWPVRLCADYAFRSIGVARSLLDATVVRGALIVTGLVAVSLVAWRRRPAVAFGALLFGMAIFPLTNFAFAVGAVRADRFLYVPLLGLALMAASLVELGAKRLARIRPEAAPVARVLGFGVPVLLLTALTVGRNPDWRTARGLWRHTVAVAPANAKARHNLALELLQDDGAPAQEMLAETALHLEAAVSAARELPGDEFFEPYINLGNVYLRQAALEMRAGPSEVSRAWTEKAAAVLEEGERRMDFHGRRRASWEAALAARAPARGGLRPEWGDAKLHLALASALDGLGRPVEAGAQLRRAIAVEPSNPSAYLRLALLYARGGSVRDVQTLLGIARGLPPPGAEDALVLAQLTSFVRQRTAAIAPQGAPDRASSTSVGR